jgi:hypothetical protein
MEDKESRGWQKLVTGYPWFNYEECYPLTAYSEFMPPPLLGRTPLGEVDNTLFLADDLYGWHITEMEEEYEIRPGIEHAGHQIMNSLIKLGSLKTTHTGLQSLHLMQVLFSMKDI